MKLGVVLLAAGRSERFGANKLLADFHGRPMVCRALDTLKQLNAQKAVVVSSSAEVAEIAKAYGFEVIINDAPQLGLSRSIRLGVSHIEKIAGMDAVLLMVADQPLLSVQSLAALISAFEKDARGLACLRDATHSGNPAVFARVYFSELMALDGDRGAKGILRANTDKLIEVDCLYPMELSDADTPQTLERLLEEKDAGLIISC